MTLRTSIIIAAFIVLASLTVPVGWNMGRDNLHGKMLATLSAYGFTNAQIGAIGLQDNHAIVTDIALDADKFSTVRAIQVNASPLEILLRTPLREIIIDDIRLTGELSEETGLTISGWKKQPLPLPSWDSFTLTGGQIDLSTSEGALRFQAKGQGTKQPGGGVKIQSLVWGVQNQIKIDTAVNGTIYPDGRWNYDIEIKDANMNFDRVQASRISGWLTFAKTETAAPELSGQIDAGKFSVGDLSFSNFNIAFQGPLDKHSIVARANVYGFNSMTATLDLKYVSGEPQIKAVVETASLDDLLTFLTQMRTSETGAGSFTSLLLTDGNLKRLRREITEHKHDTLELQIHGPLYDLIGKVVVKTYKDGDERRHIVSLDPGNG